MIFSAPYRRVAEELRKEIEDFLLSIGFLCRVFARGKSAQSLNEKILKNPEKYSNNGKLIQDAIGVRVILYFPEDISIVEELLRKRYKCDENSTTIDLPSAEIFSVTRHNLIFKVPANLKADMTTAKNNLPIDETFELQIRSILSEGWHEVEHDLRYKRKNDWINHADLSRNLNGVVAALETAEWSMRKIFDDLAYRHYKNKQWEAMLHASLKMRVAPKLSETISSTIDANPNIAKGLLRINRPKLFRTLSNLAPKVPVTLDNIVFVWAYATDEAEELKKLAPATLIERFSI